MIWWIIWVFLSAIDDINYQKAVRIGKDLSKTVYNSFRFVWWSLLSILILLFWLYSLKDFFDTNLSIFLIMTLIVIIWMITSPLRQKVYKSEKISAILPYQKINSLLIIIVSFFWFKDTSLISFLITIVLLFLLVFSSIDPKSKQKVNNKMLVIFIQMLTTIEQLLIVYVIKLVSQHFYYISYNFLGILLTNITAIILCYSWYLKQIKNQSKKFFFHRLISSFTWWISMFINAFLIKSFGAVITFLLGFLGVWVMLVMSYIFQKDRPAKKDIILAVVVSVLVWLAFILKKNF